MISNKNKVLSLFTSVFLAVALVLGLQSCSSGSSSGTSPTPPVTNEDASGLFNGTGTVNSGTALADVRGFVHGSRFMFFDEAEGVLYDGQVTGISGSNVTATFNLYKDGIKVTVTPANATGTVTNESSISLTLSGTGYAAGTLSLTFDSLYSRGATIDKLVTMRPETWLGDASTQSTYTYIDSFNNETFNGGANGGGVNCVYDGIKTIPDANINIYQLTLTVTGTSSCDHTGVGYTGFFAVVDGSSADDTLLFAASNGDTANFSIMIRDTEPL